MFTNTRIISLTVVGAIVLLAVVWVGRDLFLAKSRDIDCDDGRRKTIDLRDFVTQYSGYSIEFETALGDKAKFASKLNPVQLQQLSESLQHANEFRKFLVAGYNSCAVSTQQYTQFGASYEPNTLDRTELRNLVKQYVGLSQQLAQK